VTHKSQHADYLVNPNNNIVLRVITLAWPALMLQFMHLLINLWDRFLAGRFLQVHPDVHISIQAAQTTGQYFAWLISSYSVLVTVGSTALVARFIGGDELEKARKVVNHSFWIALILGVLAAIFGVLLLPYVLSFIGLQGNAGEEASRFLFYIFLFLPFQLIESAFISCLVGAGDTLTGLIVLVGVTILNIPLSFVFATGAIPLLGNWGFSGIALGTALSHVVGCFVICAILTRGKSDLKWEFRTLMELDLVKRMLRISIPAGMDSLSIGVGQFIFLGIVNNLGEVAAGAHGIALGWEAMGYLSGGAFGTAAIALVGLNLGASQPAEASRCAWISYFMGAGVMSFMGALFFIFAEPMFLVFCPEPSQAEIVRTGAPVLRLIAFAMPFLASCIIITSALRGAGDTRVPVIYTWIGFFLLRIPCALVFARNDLGQGQWMNALSMGLLGAWLAMFVDLFARGVMLLYRFYSGAWKKITV